VDLDCPLTTLSTHSAGALYEAFPACEPRRVLVRLEFHYVPKHASWLNMVGHCLDRRIGTRQRLESEILASERQRNAARAPDQMEVLNRHGPHKNGPRLSLQADIQRPELKE
jgi:hypothetical protein